MSATVEPIRFDASMEHPEENEAEVARELMETMRGICMTTFRDSGKPLRSVHAKSHGLVKGRLDILPGLAPHLAQGIFANADSHDAVMRFSTTPGDLLPDNVSTPRGVAIKIFNVVGERLPGAEDLHSQDFLMVNGPAFAAPTGKAFLANLKLLAATTDHLTAAKQAASTVLRGVEHVIEAFGGESGAVKSLGGHPMTHPLGHTYFSQAPILYGDYIAKLSLRPASKNLRELSGKTLSLLGKPDGLREAVIEFFATNEAVWDLCVQLCTDLETMPVEDASKPWPEDVSPYVAVAKLSAGPQQVWNSEVIREVDELMAFSPWNGIVQHRPLGSIMRVRRLSYEMSSRFRLERLDPPAPPSP